MKIKYFYLVLFSLLFAFSLNVKAGIKGKPTVTIKFTFTGIVDSCDYVNRIKVYIDSVIVATSTEKKQSETNSVSFSIKKGKYKIRIVDEVLFKGKWEEQTMANDYNIDSIYESDIEVKGNLCITLLFDLDKGVSLVP